MFDKPNASIMLGSAVSPRLDTGYISDLAARLGASQKPSVVLLTSRYDVDADLLQVYLNSEGCASIRFNCECFPSELLSHSFRSGSVRSTLRDDRGQSFSLEPKVVVYRHFHYLPPALHTAAGENLFEASQRHQMAANLEESFCRARWINHPHAVRRCRNRLVQLQTANEAGLLTPNTLITNDRTEAEAFVRENGWVIAKALDHHGVRCDSTLHNFWGTLISSPSDVLSIRQECPVLLQQYIPKTAEIRVYVIGHTVLGVRIQNKANNELPVDLHAMPLKSYSYSLCDISPATLRGCLALTGTLGLSYAAIDFVQAGDQAPIFLEVNPGGDWAWVDSQVESGLTAIFAKAIARLVSGA